MRSLLIALAVLITAAPAFGCTTFCLARNGELLFGRNYDFEIGQGFVMTNHRGVVKTSVAGSLRWTSRHASITFNQWGREFPMDGMNGAGLVIALMWLDETRYPVDDRPSLRVLEWIQYSLDNFATVAELLARVEETRVAGSTPLHYLVFDATGDSASIEWLSGRLVVNRGAAALANDSYERSMAHLRQFSGFGGSRGTPSGAASLDRFARASILMKSSDASVDGAFEILASVAQRGATRWSVVYDARRRDISWTSDRSQSRKTLRFDSMSLDCSSPRLMLDIHSPMRGDVSARMDAYSADRNRQLVASSYAQTSFTRNSPAHWAEADAAHAESFACAAGGRRRTIAR